MHAEFPHTAHRWLLGFAALHTLRVLDGAAQAMECEGAEVVAGPTLDLARAQIIVVDDGVAVGASGFCLTSAAGPVLVHSGAEATESLALSSGVMAYTAGDVDGDCTMGCAVGPRRVVLLPRTSADFAPSGVDVSNSATCETRTPPGQP